MESRLLINTSRSMLDATTAFSLDGDTDGTDHAADYLMMVID
jgi:hypothetical protein